MAGVVLNAPVEIEESLVEAGFSNEIDSGKLGFTLLFVRNRADRSSKHRLGVASLSFRFITPNCSGTRLTTRSYL
jgi:hypothetical protein